MVKVPEGEVKSKMGKTIGLLFIPQLNVKTKSSKVKTKLIKHFDLETSNIGVG